MSRFLFNKIWRPSAENWRAAILLALASLFIAMFDPMGLDQAADRRSAEAIDRVRALYYGGKEPIGRDRVVTISIDEDSLRDVGRQWPPQYGFYAEALRDLTRDGARPAVVFLDYTFLTDLYSPTERDALVDTIGEITQVRDWEHRPECLSDPIAKIGCMKAAGGVPVIVGKPYPLDRCEPTPTLLLLDRVAVLSPVGWPRLMDGWKPAISKAEYEADEDRPGGCKAVDGIRGADGRLLPIDAGRGRQVYAGVARFDLTPAAAMLAAYCIPFAGEAPSTLGACAPFVGPQSPPLPASWARSKPAKLLWGSRPSPSWLAQEKLDYQAEPDQRRIQDCEAEKVDLFRPVVVAFAQFFAPFSGDGASVQIGCPYHADFRYERFAENARSYDAEAAAALREQFVQSRVVIIGSTLRYGGDWTTSVARGNIPGMTLHAMMFDNLIEQKALSHDPPDLALGVDSGELIEILCTLLFVLLVAAFARHLRENKVADAKRAGLFVAVLLGSIILVVLLAWGLVGLCHWTSVNIQGLWAILVIGACEEFRDVVGLYAAKAWDRFHGWIGPILKRPATATDTSGPAQLSGPATPDAEPANPTEITIKTGTT